MRVGIDIVSVDRIRDVVRKWGDRFLLRVFSQKELDIAKERRGSLFYQYLAGRFAVKEAIIKTLDNPMRLKDIVVGQEITGRPVVLSPEGEFDVSISHTKEYAVAVCIRNIGRR